MKNGGVRDLEVDKVVGDIVLELKDAGEGLGVIHAGAYSEVRERLGQRLLLFGRR